MLCFKYYVFGKKEKYERLKPKLHIQRKSGDSGNILWRKSNPPRKPSPVPSEHGDGYCLCFLSVTVTIGKKTGTVFRPCQPSLNYFL